VLGVSQPVSRFCGVSGFVTVGYPLPSTSHYM
jgi:hypothetical protein